MSTQYQLTDCTEIDLKRLTKNLEFSKEENLVTWLKDLSTQSPLHILVNDNKKNEFEPIVYSDSSGKWWTSRYIGDIFFKRKHLIIKPRFGIADIVKNLYGLNVLYLENEAKYTSSDNFISYIQSLLWFTLLQKASKHTPPFIKIDENHISNMVKGKINILGSIKEKIKGTEKIASTFSIKKIKNPATICIGLAYSEVSKWLPTYKLSKQSDRTLQLIKYAVNIRSDKIPSDSELRKVRYTSLTKTYEPLVKLSKNILNRKGMNYENSDDVIVYGALLDVAELWERYLLNVLKTVFESDTTTVEHGTMTGKSSLLQSFDNIHSIGKLKPDFIIRGEKYSFIADAKYKKIGNAPWQSPKRDDLYQMSAYLSGYKTSADISMRGVLLYPALDGVEDCLPIKIEEWVQADSGRMNFLAIPIQYDAAREKLQKFKDKITV